jgi:hypothetical protein
MPQLIDAIKGTIKIINSMVKSKVNYNYKSHLENLNKA